LHAQRVGFVVSMKDLPGPEAEQNIANKYNHPCRFHKEWPGKLIPDGDKCHW
jgi:hypothetical protein